MTNMLTTSRNEYVQKAIEAVNELYREMALRFSWEIEDKNVQVDGSDDHAVKMWQWMKDNKLEVPGVELVRGKLMAYYPHTWFQVRIPTSKAEMLKATWTIDVASPHCYPNTLLIYPDSPMRQAYMIEEVIDGAPLWEGE